MNRCREFSFLFFTIFTLFALVYHVTPTIVTIAQEDEEEDEEENEETSDETFEVMANVNLEDIEKIGFIRVVAAINGQYFTTDVPFSSLKESTNTLHVKFVVNEETDLVTASSPDEFFACAYHIKGIENEYNSLIYFDCNEADILSTDYPTVIGLFKPSSLVYEKTKDMYELGKLSKNSTNQNEVKIETIVPLYDKPDAETIKIIVVIKGQVQTETIDVQDELSEIDGTTISRIFTFDRDTDIGIINVGERFHACVVSEDLNPPEGSECEKRLIKNFGDKPNPLPVR